MISFSKLSIYADAHFLQLNGQTLDGASHGEIEHFIAHSHLSELSLLVTSKTHVYTEYSKVLRTIRNDATLPMEHCEKLRKPLVKKPSTDSAPSRNYAAVC